MAKPLRRFYEDIQSKSEKAYEEVGIGGDSRGEDVLVEHVGRGALGVSVFLGDRIAAEGHTTISSTSS